MSTLEKMRARLTGGRFRWLNEQLYTTQGHTAQKLMQQHPEYFEEYHEGKGDGSAMIIRGFDVFVWLRSCVGISSRCLSPRAELVRGASDVPPIANLPSLFCLRLPIPTPPLLSLSTGFREQTKGWPLLPVDAAIGWLASCPKTWVVADLGCGDAKIAASAKQRVLSFDLVARAPGVIAANMASLPQDSASVDAAVLCLALMGTDYAAFLREAVRILRPGGALWIAEVKSRFAGPGVMDAFVAAVQALGARLKRRDEKNTHFIMLQFEKTAAGPGGKETGAAWPALGACQYKKR